jgi:hypothetical protein
MRVNRFVTPAPFRAKGALFCSHPAFCRAGNCLLTEELSE